MELNEKLLRFAGFKPSTYRDEEHPSKEYKCWILPSAHKAYITEQEAPNFTESLDACFKWLVPKLKGENTWNISIESLVAFPNVYLADIRDNLNPHTQGIYKGTAETPALALCLAIEKLIGGEYE